ncbi:MAG: archease [Dehalococcoidia bacterium]
MEGFRVIEHTADVGIVAHGRDLREAYVNAARGLFSIIVDSGEIAEDTCRRVEATATDREALLVEWLNQLIYLFDVDNLIFKTFDILQLTNTGLRANCYGEKIVPGRHRINIGVKAATYHMLKIEEENGFRAHVLFDI